MTQKTIAASKVAVSKSQIQCYKFRAKNMSWTWADISIDDNGESGRIQIASDFGDWQYYWSACGMPFKKFLSELNIDYMAGKMGAGKFFDHDATLDLYRKETIKDKRKEKKGGYIAELKELEDLARLDEFCYHLKSCQLLMRLFDGMPE